MTNCPDAGSITVLQTLEVLEDKFQEFAMGVADGRYAFWLGSGISMSRFPMLPELVAKVLEFLRANVQQDNDACSYKEALERALDLSNLTGDERGLIDINVPVSEWPKQLNLPKKIANHYAQFLNIDVAGEEDDLLVWEGVDVVGTYADPNVDPAVEHFTLAAMVKEGMVSELASANWDGLIEKAIMAISNGVCELDVCVKSEDLQNPNHRAKLIKFHGCAVRAADNSDEFREYIVGRQDQIDRWRDEHKNQGMVHHLLHTVMENPTLMLGLSVQDENIRNLFALAQNHLAWDWPGERPACVFSNNQIGEAQRSLLANVFREHYTGPTRNEILENVLVRSYASQLLPALFLFGLEKKLVRIASMLSNEKPVDFGNWVASSLRELRNTLARECKSERKDKGDTLGFVKVLLSEITKTKCLMTTGSLPDDQSIYEPLTETSVRNIEMSNLMRNSGLPEASIAAAILGAGCAAGKWKIGSVENVGLNTGMFILNNGDKSTPMFLVADAMVEHYLISNGHLDETDDAIVIHAKPMHTRLQRHPEKSFGRRPSARVRRTSISSILSDVSEGAELVERFEVETMP